MTMNPFQTVESAISWAEGQDWCRNMASCPQDPKFHMEGDVWTHTKRVLRELPQVPGWNELASDDRQALTAAGLLHDSGKPRTTLDENGTITSRGHSRAGARLARNVLRELGMALAERERVVNLVACHGWPPRILDRSRPEMEVIKAAWLARNDLLWALSWADAKGRLGQDTGFLDAVSLWRDIALENDCWRHPLPGANAEAKLLAFDGKDIRFYKPQEPNRGRMIMMSGLPGTGKDTWLHEHFPEMPVVSLDALRESMDVDPDDAQGSVVDAAKELARQHLRQGTAFSFNATNVTRETRARWIRLARDYDFQVAVVYIEPPLAAILEQNMRRPSPVPESVIMKLLAKLEAPSGNEAHEVTLLP